MSCFCKNLDTTSGPNVKDTPRSFSDHPVISLSGSDHSRSHSKPSRVRHSSSSKMCNKPTCVRNIRRSHNSPYLLHGLKIGAETTVHREDLFIDDSSYRETIKAIRKRLPQLDIVTPFACQCHQSVIVKNRNATYIRHRNRRFGLYLHTRGCPGG